MGCLQHDVKGISISTPEDLCKHLLMIVVEQSTLQRAGCGKAARPDLKRGMGSNPHIYSTIKYRRNIGV